MMMSRLTPLAAAGLLAVVLAAPALPLAAQCAMCKATLESSADAVGATFNRAILVMMAGPYLVLGVFGMVFFRERLRGRARGLLARLRRAGPGRVR